MYRFKKSQVIDQFQYNWKVNVKSGGHSDKVAKRTMWNEFVDYLHKDGMLTDYQAYNWVNPYN